MVALTSKEYICILTFSALFTDTLSIGCFFSALVPSLSVEVINYSLSVDSGRETLKSNNILNLF